MRLPPRIDQGQFQKKITLPFLDPENLIVGIGVKRRVDINQVNAPIGKLFELIEIAALLPRPSSGQE
jgi:hypothetical protein